MTEDADPDLAEMARGEVESLSAELETLDAELSALFTPKDPNDEKNAIFEIRAGTGRRRGGALRRRPLPDVHPLRGEPRLEDRAPLELAHARVVASRR